MFIMALAAAILCGCEKEIMSESTAANDDATTVSDGSPVGKTKKFTFTLKGDFSSDWKTRGYLSADGKDLTDVWVLDYQGGVLVQQVHQDDNTADDFGQPVMNLAYGSHHVYFIASRGQTATLDTDNRASPSTSKLCDTAIPMTLAARTILPRSPAGSLPPCASWTRSRWT